MCGIVGTIGNQDVALDIYEALLALQHRGQESAGMVTYNSQFHMRKSMGLVRDVFKNSHIQNLRGNVGIGMVRYSTVGTGSFEEAQPFIVNSPYGISLIYNGTIYNSWELKEELFRLDLRFTNSNNDAEVLLHLFANGLTQARGVTLFDRIRQAVFHVFRRAKGGYSVALLIAGKGLVVFRDPHGIRPLVWGQRLGKPHGEHLFASENTMFQFLGYEFHRDVEPGEVIFVDLQGTVHSAVVLQQEFRPCVFEYVYFARPDALLNGVSVYRSRLRMGQNLAEKIKRVHPNLPIDVVIPIPTTASTAALACAHELGARYTEALVKNQFIGRTFIMPGQRLRQRANRYKLSVIDFEVKDNNVLLVDDSIVRGNVARHIVSLMRAHGAKNVYLASASPPLRWPDLYGIDLPTREEYLAYNKTEEEIRQILGVDVLVYQDLEGLVEAVTRRGDLKFTRPHTAFFDGDYPTEGVTEEVLQQIERNRQQERESAVPVHMV